MLKFTLFLHVLGGSAALLSMFVPMLSRKGGSLHRRAGWIFVGGMTTVSLTAFVLGGARFLTDPRPEARQMGLFLFYVGLLTGTSVSAGVRVLRAKRRTTPHGHPWDVGLPATLTVASVAMMAYGLATGVALFIALPVVGLINGGTSLRYWLRSPSHPMHWWFEHMSSMLGAAIAATTAFLVVNAGNLGLPSTSLVVWLGPTMIGSPSIAVWSAYYARKFAHMRRPETAAPATIAAGVLRPEPARHQITKFVRLADTG